MAYVVRATERGGGPGRMVRAFFLGFGDRWVSEYPDAQEFARLNVAKVAAHDAKLPAGSFDVKVYTNYGFDSERVVAEVQR